MRIILQPLCWAERTEKSRADSSGQKIALLKETCDEEFVPLRKDRGMVPAPEEMRGEALFVYSIDFTSKTDRIL